MKRLFAVLLFVFVSQPSIASALFVGPYSGTVTDSQTGEPIEGASVLIYWTKRIPNMGGGSTEHVGTVLVYTDQKGKYDIVKAFYNLGLMGFFESTNMVVYQPGYQAYIKQIWKDNTYSKPDTSFKEKDNVVKVDRIPPNFSHRNHYEKIDEALWGIRDYPYVYPLSQDRMTWQRLLDMNLKAIPEKEEFLRRVEWEERRGMMEERK